MSLKYCTVYALFSPIFLYIRLMMPKCFSKNVVMEGHMTFVFGFGVMLMLRNVIIIPLGL